MGPSRCTRSSSRQSSILKPSKPRQPLQNLNFNSSSNENSPTVTAKIKRRVSFAEKKHVKEFCNSLEDGTVWNNTYEEQDLSNHKTCNSHEEDPTVENVFNDTRENDVQYDCNELTERDLNVEDCNLQATNTPEDVDDQDEVVLIQSSSTLHDDEATCTVDFQSKNGRVSQSIIVYEDVDEKLPEQLSNSVAQNLYCDKLDDTSPQNTSMDFTTVISSVINPADDNNEPELAESFVEDEKVDNVSMEMTMAIPSALSNLQQANVNRTSLCPPNLLSRDTDDRTSIFLDVSMDVTKPVIDIGSPDERTRLLNVSMEMTTAIPVNVHSMIKNQKRDEMTCASIENSYKILRYDSEAYETSANIDRTRVCNDDAMEFTTAITSLPKILPHNLPQEILTKNTSYVHPPPLNSVLGRCSRNEDLQSSRTTIFHDNSMTMTKVVSSLNTRDRAVELEDPELDANNQDSGKTMLFRNTSMEMTEAVPRMEIPARSSIPMEMTEAVPVIQIPTRSSIPMEMTEAVPVTQIPARSSIPMEMTEAVPVIQIPTRSNVSMEMTEAVPRMEVTARSSIAMEMTEAVPMLQIPTRSSIPMEMTEAVPKMEITAGSSIAMEMTEAVPVIQIPTRSSIPMEMTEAVPMIQIPTRSSIPMEMTEAVPMLQIPTRSSIPMEMTEAVPKMEITARSSIAMEMTEAVPVIQIPTRSSIPMEMTEAVPVIQIPTRSSIPMEMTEAVPVIQIPARSSIPMEMTEAIPRMEITARSSIPMEMTEAVPMIQIPTRSSIPMEMTEAVPMIQIPTRSSIPMEMTEAVPMLQIPTRSNLSLEMTEAVPRMEVTARSSIPMEMTEAVPMTKIPVQLNASMEITEAVAISEVSAQPNVSIETTEARIVSQTPAQLNASMEITEAALTSQTSQLKSLDENSTEVRKSVSPNSENVETRDLVNLSAQAEDALKDTTATLIPPSLKSDTISEKEDNDVHNNSPKNVDDNNGAVSQFTSKIPKLANIKPSMALHELSQQHNASASRESNTGAACAAFNNSSSAVNSELSKNEPVSRREAHLRRTYTIQPLSNDRTFAADTNEADQISQCNDVTLRGTLNDKERSVLMSNSVDNLQNSEWNESLEQIESIKPPEFMCLDDLSIANVEVNAEPSCLLKNNENEDTSKMDSHAELEKLRKSQTFLIKRASDANDSKFEVEDRIPADEVQNVLNKDANTDVQVWECSSSTIDETEADRDPNLAAENCNLEDQVMECSSSDVKASDKRAVQAENKLIDTPMMEVDSERHLEEKSRLSSHLPSSCAQENNSVELNPFSVLMNELKACAKSDHIIWEVYHENIERHLFVIGFISSSLLVAIYLRDPCDITNDQFIREIKMISRLADDAETLISIVHRVILEKLDTKVLLDSYKDREDILPMLNHISTEVKLAMDFMFDVRRLNDINLMEVTRDSVSFVSRTNRRKILLNVTIEMKPFDKIESRNISVRCLLGSVREEDVKKLITNIKRDHKFLRRYINDVKDYIDLMEQ